MLEFVKHTCIPETVKYGISNLTQIGAFLSTASSDKTEGSLNSAFNKNSYKKIQLM